MPALRALFTGDATQLFNTLKGLPSATAQAVRGMRKEMNSVFGVGQSTIFNPSQARDAVREYGQWWDRALTEQSVRAATRANRARSIMRQRSASQAIIAMELASQRARDSANPFAENAGAGSAAGSAAKSGIMASLATRFAGPGVVVGAAYGAAKLVGASIQADIAFQRVRNTLESVTKSSEKTEAEFEFLRQESDRVGFSFIGIADDYARFTVASNAAGLSTEQTRKIFISLQEAGAVMGLSTQRTSEAMLALEQMLSKGTVQSQELRLQLGNALPGASAIFARALHVSQQELAKMVESGQLLSKDVLPKFAEELKRSFTLTEDANKAARDINRLTNAWTELKAELGSEIRTPTSSVLETLKTLAAGTRVLISGDLGDAMANLRPDVRNLNIDNAQAKGRIAVMQQMADAAKELHDRLKAITELKPIDRNIKLDPKEIKRTWEEASRVSDQAADQEERNRFNNMTPGERRAELQRQRAEHQKSMAMLEELQKKQPDANAALNIALHRKAIADIESQISDLDGKKNKQPSRRGGGAIQMTEWERAGGFMAGPSTELRDIGKAQLVELREIRKHLGGRAATKFVGRGRTRY